MTTAPGGEDTGAVGSGEAPTTSATSSSVERNYPSIWGGF